MLTHERVDAFNRYLQTTLGREKLCRLVQYFARFYVFYLFRIGAPKDTVRRWEDLKQHIGNGRKFFRLLKPVEFAQAGVKGLAVKDEVLRVTAVLKQTGMFLYYSTEIFVLANAINFYKPANIKKINEFGQKCWFLGIASSLLSGLYKLRQLSIRSQMLDKSRKALTEDEKSGDRSAELKLEEKTLARDKSAAQYQVVQDAVDIIIPSANLGWISADEGVVGIAGMITSIMAMRSHWNKLNP